MPVRHVVDRAAGASNTLASFRKELVRTGLAFDLQFKTHVARRPESRAQKRKRFVRSQKKTHRVGLGTQAANFIAWQHNAAQFLKKESSQTASSRCVICGYRMHGAIARHEVQSREWADSDGRKMQIVFVEGEGWAHTACDEHVKEHNRKPQSLHEKLLRIKDLQDSEQAAQTLATRQDRAARRVGTKWFGPQSAQGVEDKLIDIDNTHAKLDGGRRVASSSSSSQLAKQRNVAEVLEAALPTTPIEEVAQLINRHVGWEFLSEQAMRELRRRGVHSLHRLRALTSTRWTKLPFSQTHRELIQRVVGEEPAYHTEFLKDYRFDRSNPRLLTNSMEVSSVTDQELIESASMSAVLQKQVDRERVFSFREEFRDEISPVARPHAPPKQKKKAQLDPNATFHMRYQMDMPVGRVWLRENTKYHDRVSTNASKRREMLRKAYESSTKGEDGGGGMEPPVMEVTPRPFSIGEQKKMKLEDKMAARGGRAGKKI